jgi:hypothetical protein
MKYLINFFFKTSYTQIVGDLKAIKHTKIINNNNNQRTSLFTNSVGGEMRRSFLVVDMHPTTLATHKASFLPSFLPSFPFFLSFLASPR